MTLIFPQGLWTSPLSDGDPLLSLEQTAGVVGMWVASLMEHTLKSSLLPRSHTWGGKRIWWLWARRLVQLTTRGGFCKSQSDHSLSPLKRLTNRRNVNSIVCYRNLNRLIYNLTDQSDLRALFKYTHTQSQAKPPWVCGWDYNIIPEVTYDAWTWSKWTTIICLGQLILVQNPIHYPNQPLLLPPLHTHKFRVRYTEGHRISSFMRSRCHS